VYYGGQVGNRYVRQGGQTENQGGKTNFIKQMFVHPGLKPCWCPWLYHAVRELNHCLTAGNKKKLQARATIPVLHFPPLQFGADNSSLAFSVAPLL